MSNNKFLKGSEWLKWDLHIHTPYSKDCYGKHDNEEIWNKFFKELEDSKLDVIGINDYGFIDGYKKVIEAKKNNNRISNIKLILPVIELRIDTFVDLKKSINIHLVISNQLSSDSINKQIINSLKFSNSTIVQPEDILKNLATGMDAIDNNSLKSMLKVHRDSLIVGISYNEVAQIKSNYTLLVNTLKSLEVDFIFCATKHSDFDKKLSDIKEIDAFKELAVINASDKHNFKEKDGHCNDFSKFSWIKANPTFDGLRLAIQSPDDRVCIKDNAPVDKNNIYKIKNIKSEVFADNKLELNEHGLISIIGNKAQGKSLLGSIIASIDVNKNKGSLKNYDFMNEVKIEFNDNIPNNIKCKWLNQNYIEQIVNHRDSADLQKELERIVFSHAENVEKEINNLNENIKRRQNDINELNSSFASHNKCQYEIEVLREKEKNYENEKERYEELKCQNEAITASEEYKCLTSIRKGKEAVEDKLNKAKDLITNLEGINEQYNKYIEFSICENKKIKEKLEDYKEILSELNISNLNEFYFDEKLEKQKAASDILSTELEKKKKELLAKIENSEEQLNQKTSCLEKTQECNLQEIKDISEIDEKINGFIKDIENNKKEKDKKEKEIEKIEKDKKNHKQEFINLFKLFSERKNKYIEIQKNINASINNLTSNNNEHNKLYLRDFANELKEVNFKVNYDSEVTLKYRESVLEFLDNRMVNVNNIAKEFNECIDKLLNSKCIENDAESLYNIIIKHFLDRDINKKLKSNFRDSNDKYCDYNEIYLNKIFKIDLRVSYEILYKNKEIKKLSAGERGTVLLLLYLLLDKEYEKYPLIVDQPEDNIDNQTVNKTLVPALKVAKQKRQIFLITHNPNLVVNTDSEQVILAKGQQCNKYTYQCGALENPEIAGSICQILEGGKEAFKKRYQNYYLQDSKILNNKKF